MAITKASSFTPEPNPDKAAAAIQKPTTNTQRTTAPKSVGAGQLQIPVDAIDRQADLLASQYISRFQNTLTIKTQEKMVDLFETWMPDFDEQMAQTIDAVAVEIASGSHSLNGHQPRSLGSAD